LRFLTQGGFLLPDLAFGFGDCPLGVCENADEENDAEIAVVKKIIDTIRATLILIEAPPHILLRGGFRVARPILPELGWMPTTERSCGPPALTA
jgi:hypothetical protein